MPGRPKFSTGLTLEGTPRFTLPVMTELTVSKLADAAEVGPDTIRYYEKEGLLQKPDRSPAGYRLYAGSAVDRVRFIKDGQALGLKLAQIKELLEIRDQGRCPCGHTTAIIGERLAYMEEEIIRLETMGTQLRKMKKSSINGTYDWCCPSRAEGGVKKWQSDR